MHDEKNWFDEIIPWLMTAAVIYYGTHVVVAIAKGWLSWPL